VTGTEAILARVRYRTDRMCFGAHTVFVNLDNLLRPMWPDRLNPLSEAIMNKHQIKGRITQAKGKVKEITGRLFGDKPLERKGRVTEAGGKIEAGYGDLKDDVQKRH
jgi:uncharacterized protein YjbJ (UPF0337 family)